MSIKFTCSHNNTFSDTVKETVTIEIHEGSSLSEVLDTFERFLKACGYHFDGNVTIEEQFDFFNDVEDESYESTSLDEPLEQEDYSASAWPFPTHSRP